MRHTTASGAILSVFLLEQTDLPITFAATGSGLGIGFSRRLCKNYIINHSQQVQSFNTGDEEDEIERCLLVSRLVEMTSAIRGTNTDHF